ncbi:hypothetical protein Nepgr_026118 [Nepenthes gracilis]|uniref:Uncharacterized protein n=1 Tax=Nepenthes gracilis TaxID=150966 RepID=A0AAD3T6C5_NEPGR|nr:hypothetical protein Nepgr_026118 [Nepenthes gracilis]
MEAKIWAVVVLLALVMAAESSSPLSSFDEGQWGLNTHFSSGDGGLLAAQRCNGHVGDCIEAEAEMMMDSEAGRRQLAAQKGFISYAALKRNSIPCSRRGHSYYNCQGNVKANPYRRGCTAITHCKRYTK